jgi:hypothetical protein
VMRLLPQANGVVIGGPAGCFGAIGSIQEPIAPMLTPEGLKDR